MITALLTGLTANPRVRTALRYGAISVAVLLFLLAPRRSGERAGRFAERLEPQRRSMTSNARCSRRRLAALAIATISLTGCAMGVSEPSIVTVCPPVAEYSREFQARAAEELGLLPDGSAMAEMLAD